MVDPYEMLRRARGILEKRARQKIPEAMAWMQEYKKLAGARLTHKEVRVLRDPHRRMRGMNQDIVAKLLTGGYLQKVRQMRGNAPRITHFTQLRINKKGNEALRLREDVDR